VKLWIGIALAMCVSAQDRLELLGEQVARDIRQRTVPADPAIQEYVRSVARRVQPAGSQWVVETVAGITGGMSNVWPAWMPCHVFVSSDVVASTRSEAELAGVLAHAMAHRAERKGAMIVATGEAIHSAEEIRADREAIAGMAAAGYDPRALIDYVGRTVPRSSRRIEAMKEARSAIPPRAEWIQNTAEFEKARALARPAPLKRKPSLYD
jgi:predicted Zn-dependent protease